MNTGAQNYMERADVGRIAQSVRQRQISNTAESSEFCIECGKMIPDELRHTVPGVDTCLHHREIQQRKLMQGCAA